MCGKRAGSFAWPRSSRWAFCFCSRRICIRVSAPRLRVCGKMKMPVRRLLWAVLAGVLLLQADFQPSRWQFRRPLSVDSGAGTVVLNGAINIDRGIYVRSQPGLADLRVVQRGPGGPEEVPYVLEKLSGS